MKLALSITALLFLATTAVQCCKQQELAPAANSTGTGCYKGRLEIKGICMNYTIKLVEGTLPTSKAQASWTDPATGKVYTNVFALANVCEFPADIKEGDEFYFQVSENPRNDCVVCQAYRARPNVHTAITLLSGGCVPEAGTK